MSATRQQIADTTRGWLNTPYQHEGRLKGIGVDCVGLLIGVARELRLSTFDVVGYSRQPSPRDLERHAERELHRVTEPKLGDVLLFRVENQPQHFGIITVEPRGGAPAMFAHAFEKVGRVAENNLDAFWQQRVLKTYRFPGVE